LRNGFAVLLIFFSIATVPLAYPLFTRTQTVTTITTLPWTPSEPWTITLKVDKQTYTQNEPVHITGALAGRGPFTCPTNYTCDWALYPTVEILILDQNGNSLFSKILSLGGFDVLPPYNFDAVYAPTSPMQPGSYNVSARAFMQSPNPLTTASTSFTVVAVAVTIPGFSAETILAGIALGVLALGYARRSRRGTDPSTRLNAW
jgi:hypothetical protein